MHLIFGWVAAICLTAFVFAFAAGMLLRSWLSRWSTNDRFNRVTGKLFAVVVVLGTPPCSLAWLTGWSGFGYLWLATTCWLVVQQRFLVVNQGRWPGPVNGST